MPDLVSLEWSLGLAVAGQLPTWFRVSPALRTLLPNERPWQDWGIRGRRQSLLWPELCWSKIHMLKSEPTVPQNVPPYLGTQPSSRWASWRHPLWPVSLCRRKEHGHMKVSQEEWPPEGTWEGDHPASKERGPRTKPKRWTPTSWSWTSSL